MVELSEDNNPSFWTTWVQPVVAEERRGNLRFIRFHWISFGVKKWGEETGFEKITILLSPSSYTKDRNGFSELKMGAGITPAHMVCRPL